MKRKMVVVLLCVIALGGCSARDRGENAGTDDSITIEIGEHIDDTVSETLSDGTSAEAGNTQSSGATGNSEVIETSENSATPGTSGISAGISDAEVETEREQSMKENSELMQIAMGETFPASASEVSEGELLYSIEAREVYTSLSDCFLTREDMTNLENGYNDPEWTQNYSAFEDIIDGQGQIDSLFRFLLLDVRIQNVDAVGTVKKNEFNIYGITMEDPVANERYHICYFSEAENSPVEDQEYYFTLKQGEEITVKIGFLAPAEGLENHQIRCCYSYSDREIMIDLGI